MEHVAAHATYAEAGNPWWLDDFETHANHRWVFGPKDSGKWAAGVRHHATSDISYVSGSPRATRTCPAEGKLLLVDVLDDENDFGQGEVLQLLRKSKGTVVLLSTETPDVLWKRLFGNLGFARIEQACEIERCYRTLNAQGEVEYKSEIVSSPSYGAAKQPRGNFGRACQPTPPLRAARRS